jgi:RecJ-like exonuclease
MPFPPPPIPPRKRTVFDEKKYQEHLMYGNDEAFDRELDLQLVKSGLRKKSKKKVKREVCSTCGGKSHGITCDYCGNPL